MADTTASDTLPAEGAIPGLPPDWPQQATTRVVDVVDTVRVKTSGPAVQISRAIVYGLVAIILLLVAVPLLLVGLTRGLISLVEIGTSAEQAAWISYAGIGTVFTLIGLLLWSRRPKGAARV